MKKYNNFDTAKGILIAIPIAIGMWAIIATIVIMLIRAISG